MSEWVSEYVTGQKHDWVAESATNSVVYDSLYSLREENVALDIVYSAICWQAYGHRKTKTKVILMKFIHHNGWAVSF